jgi:hypothetical protein
MKRTLVVLVLLCAAALLPVARAQNNGAVQMPKVGDLAPDFTLKYYDGSFPPKEIKLSDYRGKKQVVLAFYIFAFTGG